MSYNQTILTNSIIKSLTSQYANFDKEFFSSLSGNFSNVHNIESIKTSYKELLK